MLVLQAETLYIEWRYKGGALPAVWCPKVRALT